MRCVCMSTTPQSFAASSAVAAVDSCSALEQRHARQITGRLICYDRLLIFGTQQSLHNPNTIFHLLAAHHFRPFELSDFFAPLTQQIRGNAEEMARKAGLAVRFVADHKTRKEDLVSEIIRVRGEHPGLVCVLSAMERCMTFKPRKAGGNHRSDWLKLESGRCLHYYFYFIDENLGLLHVRVPTWAPFRLQFCLNGHQWLACRMRQEGLTFTRQDNAFTQISDWGKAQELSAKVPVRELEHRLHHYARLCCPAAAHFDRYYLSIAEAELSLDLAFAGGEEALAPLCESLCRHSMLTTRIENMAAWFDKKLSAEAQASSRFTSLSQSIWRVRHHLGSQSLKLYNKGGVLRLEVTSNDITFYRHHRKVAKAGGGHEMKNAPLKKQVFSLQDLYGLMKRACLRYLDHLSVLEDQEIGRHNLEDITRPKRDKKQRSWRGINFFRADDLQLVLSLLRGEGQISGWTHRRLHKVLGKDKSSGAVSRMLRRLREHGLLRRVRNTFTYYLTALGKRALVAALKIKDHLILPTLQNTAST